MLRWPDGPIEPAKKRYSRALEDVAHILVNEDGLR
jgi:hypothetical protein